MPTAPTAPYNPLRLLAAAPALLLSALLGPALAIFPSRPASTVLQSVERTQLRTDVSEVGALLKHELAGLSPEMHGKIESTIRSSNVDRNKYRDIFIIKKRVVSDGEKQMVMMDITEKIIPKGGVSGVEWYNKLLIGMTLLLLAGLVMTTTHRMYESVMKRRGIGELGI